ncbi:MAG: YhcH/YjgK/YiaL family protein, partial [Tidjanibacter sp.]|nr:YhcH/YjgK/YiaL family protein [Tidjanibacter sp.]
KPGQLAIFYPEDGHAPGISDGPIRKFIAKIKI